MINPRVFLNSNHPKFQPTIIYRLPMQSAILYFFVLLLMTHCSSSTGLASSEERLDLANQLAEKANWKKEIIATDFFSIVTYSPTQKIKTKTLSIYIEGDGTPWVSKTKISADPSPQNPIGLKLALKHPNTATAYIARPCQYLGTEKEKLCTKNAWTKARFSKEVIDSSSQAIDKLKQEFNAEQLQLIGYSGGGAVATIIAAQRSDVVSLITLAGNLDHSAWTKALSISSLSNSLNPADFWETLQNKNQTHFVGRDDRIIGINVAESFISNFPEHKKPNLRVIDKFTHSCCWVDEWPMLLESTTFTE